MSRRLDRYVLGFDSADRIDASAGCSAAAAPASPCACRSPDTLYERVVVSLRTLRGRLSSGKQNS